MKYLVFYLLLSMMVISCSDQQTQTLNGARYIIDLDGQKESSVPLSSMFKNVKTIILETNEQCLIGRIDEFQVFDGGIYVLDRQIAKGLFVFDTNGRFVRKIGRIGKGPGEYTRIDDFTLDADNRFIFLCDQFNRIHKYRLDGTYINTVTVQTRATIRYIQCYRGRMYADLFSAECAPDDCILAEIDVNNGNIRSQHLHLKDNNGWVLPLSSGSVFKSRLGHPPKYARLFMHNIVTVDETVSPYIELKSQNLISEEDIKELAGGTITNQFEALARGPKFWGLINFVESNDFVVFKMLTSFVVVFKKKSGEVILADYLNNDIIFKNSDNDWYSRFGFSDAHGAYAAIPSSLLDDFQASVRNNEVRPGLDKIDQLMQLDVASCNPVIFFYGFT